MNREIAELREVINKLVPMLTGKGLRVTQRGSQAYVEADPRTNKPIRVNIPSIPDNASPDFIAAVAGFVDHEVAHVLFTDWKWYGGDGVKLNKFSPEGKALTNMHNIIEDTMIERLIVEVFPGSRKNLAQLHEHFLAKITGPAVVNARSEEERFAYLIVPMMRALSGQAIFQEWMDANGHWKHPMVENLHMAMSDESLEMIKAARTTKQTLEVAQEVHDILFMMKQREEEEQEKREEQKRQQQQQQKQKGQSQNKPEKEAGKGDGTGERKHTQKPEEEDDEAEGEASGKSKGKSKDEAEEDEAEGAGGSAGEEKAEDEKEEDQAAAGGEAGEEDEEEAPSDDEATGNGSGDDDAEDAADGEEAEGDNGADDDADEGDSDGDAGADDEAGGGSEGEEDGEDDGDRLSNGAGESEEEQEDYAGHETGGTDEESNPTEPMDHDGAGGEAGKSMFDLDPNNFKPLDLSSAIAAEIEQMASKSIKDSSYSVFTKDEDRIEVFQVPDRNMRDEWVPQMDDRVQSLIGPMQKEIERMMAAQTFSVRTPGHRSGRLHAPSLYRIMQGDARVFQRKEEHKAKDTAVILLCDNSGSMHGAKMATAMMSAYALAQTLERVNIPNEVIGFTTGSLSNQAIQQLRDEAGKGVRYHRASTVIMPIYKEFNERVTPAVKRRIAYQVNVQAGLNTNTDGESLEYAALRLLPRREKRKVLIVLSDGQPVGENAPWHLRHTVQQLEKQGVETVGIGINSNAVQSYYPRSLVLHKVEDLPAAVMGELRRILSK